MARQISNSIRGITIHNTGNGYSAYELCNMVQRNLCHFLVDENEVIQTTPVGEMAMHTGKGYDFGNMYTIAIEICRSTTDLYPLAEARAIELVKGLMKMYDLEPKDIYFHIDFDPNTYCPHRILTDYGSKEKWIKGVEICQ